MATQKMAKTTTSEVVENEPVVKQAKVEKKKFEASDPIPCKSITSGELFMVGAKSKLLYKWADYNDVQEVEYQDLLYDVRTGNSFSKYPRFIVLDEDFVNQNSQLDAIYNSLYSKNDLREILNLPASEIKGVVSQLPKGAKESLKSIVATGIMNGTFDSVSKIKVMDEIFGTQMLQTLADN